MADGEIACPKCKQPMHDGFKIDDIHVRAWGLGMWFEGKAEFTRTDLLTAVELHRPFPITATYRCMSCGYLESYAAPGKEPDLVANNPSGLGAAFIRRLNRMAGRQSTK